MHIDCLPPSRLTSCHREAWQTLRRGQTGLDDPFLSYEFFELVDAVRGGVEIAVFSDGGRPVGFLPLERHAAAGHPAGMRVSEIHGVIAPDDLPWDPPAVLRSLGLSAWHYGCLPVAHAALRPYHVCHNRYPCIDVRAGFADYARERRQAGSQQIEQIRRKARKFEREYGPLHFVWHAADADALERLIAWKSEQYRRTGTLDLFRFEWVLELVRRASRQAAESFAGVLSVLYGGDRILAVHLGLRSGNVLCWWLPAYDRRFARYSPGGILTLRVVEAAAQQGIGRIDLGQGEERYKQSLANASFPVAEGTVYLRTWQRARRRAWIEVRNWAQSTPACTTPLRMFRSLRNRWIHA